MKMVKTQVYLPDRDLRRMRELSKERGTPIAHMVREAVAEAYLRPPAVGPIALWDGEIGGGSAAHDSAFDEPWEG